MNNYEGAKEITKISPSVRITLEAIKIAQELAAEDEARLGRPLTDSEVGAIATMVERAVRHGIDLFIDLSRLAISR